MQAVTITTAAASGDRGPADGSREALERAAGGPIGLVSASQAKVAICLGLVEHRLRDVRGRLVELAGLAAIAGVAPLGVEVDAVPTRVDRAYIGAVRPI